MKAMYKRIKEKAKVLYHYNFIDENEKNFIKHNKENWGDILNKNNKPKRNMVLLEFCSLQHCVISWSYFANFFANMYDADIYTYGMPYEKRNKTLLKIYESFNVKKFIEEKFSKSYEKDLKLLANRLLSNIKSKNELRDYEFCGVNVGQDIYEAYLIQGNPTINFNDNKLQNIFFKAILKVIFWENYLKYNPVKTIIVSHDCYLGNIIRRIANKYDINVYQITTFFGCKLTKEYNSGSNFKYYKNLFLQLDSEERMGLKQWAKERLLRRFSGEVGVDMPYSHKSSFGEFKNKRVLKMGTNIKVLICTHCFFDNPYAYGKNILFPDFYEWLMFLGEMSKKTCYDWYLKCHPDYREGTKEILSQILEKYPNITMLPEDVPHQQLVDEGIKFVFTVYGTVGCEYPLMGVQVINAGNNPHIAYDFCWNPSTVEELEFLVMNLEKLNKHINKDEIYEFYGLHHKYAAYFSENRKINNVFFHSEDDLRTFLGEEMYTSKMYKYFLKDFNENKHREILKNIEKFYIKMEEYSDNKIVSKET